MHLWMAPKGGVARALARNMAVMVTAVMLAGGTAADAVVLNAASGVAVVGKSYDPRFEGVGRIECHDPAKRGRSYRATGWLAGSADTVMTAAHIFFPRSRPNGGRANIVNPGDCIFILYDGDQKVREVANIRYGLSPWAKTRFRGDSSHDVAVLKLERAVSVDNIPPVKTSAAVEKPSIDLIAFHTGFRDTQCAWITRGTQQAFPPSQLRYDASDLRITSATRLFTTSADSTPSSSGGMYYDERLRAAVGLHLGAMCDRVRPRYDPEGCFNYGLRFDAAIVAMVEAVVRDEAHDSPLSIIDNMPPQPALSGQLPLRAAR